MGRRGVIFWVFVVKLVTTNLRKQIPSYEIYIERFPTNIAVLVVMPIDETFEFDMKQIDEVLIDLWKTFSVI